MTYEIRQGADLREFFAGLEELGWEKVMVEFECGMPPNGHRKLVANHKDGLRDDREGNLVMDDLAVSVAMTLAAA